jgi:hypothetical protein
MHPRRSPTAIGNVEGRLGRPLGASIALELRELLDVVRSNRRQQRLA